MSDLLVLLLTVCILGMSLWLMLVGGVVSGLVLLLVLLLFIAAITGSVSFVGRLFGPR